VKTLETERLVIRPFVEADIEGIYRLVYADPDVRRGWSSFTGGLEAFRERFPTSRVWTSPDEFGYRALVRREDNVLLGLMGFQDHGWDDMTWLLMPDGSRNVGHIPGVLDVELTYALGKAYWGHGYATEAGQAMVAYGLRELDIDRIINAISPTNRHSYALMVRLGFTFLDNGNPEDVIGMLANPNRSVPLP
jgi:RimJ/RimL family protein N-acetyltransferase